MQCDCACRQGHPPPRPTPLSKMGPSCSHPLCNRREMSQRHAVPCCGPARRGAHPRPVGLPVGLPDGPQDACRRVEAVEACNRRAVPSGSKTPAQPASASQCRAQASTALTPGHSLPNGQQGSVTALPRLPALPSSLESRPSRSIDDQRGIDGGGTRDS